MPHLLIVTAPFYLEITDELRKGAIQTCEKHQVTFDEISVPGAFEIPPAISYAAAGSKYDGFVALGCIIRGETTHYETICNESARGLMDSMLRQNAAIGNGILTVENRQQATTRANINEGNKGGGATSACLHLIETRNRFSS